MKSSKSKEEIYREAFALFLNKPIPEKIFSQYINDEDEGAHNLQHWIVDNMKPELLDWCTGIGIIEAVEHLYHAAYENGNLINN